MVLQAPGGMRSAVRMEDPSEYVCPSVLNLKRKAIIPSVWTRLDAWLVKYRHIPALKEA